MSKAFTRESDESAEDFTLQPFTPPAVKRYITREGAERLRQQAAALLEEKRALVNGGDAGGTDTARIRRIEANIQKLQRTLDSVMVAEPPVDTSKVGFGASVRIRDQNGEEDITTSVFDMLLRGLFGFERTDDPAAFYLTPTPLTTNWHGIDNLPLSGPVRLSIQMKKDGTKTACQVRFSGPQKNLGDVTVYRAHSETGAREQVARKSLDPRGAVEVLLESANRSRYLWEIR